VASNYEGICEENRRRYGTEIGRIGQMLLADRYDDRTHFIFELLQNSEDALSRRGAWNGFRRVNFDLTPARLALSHFGRPFDEADVRGVCGIAESTKDKFSIGRFGIGFKSVYTFTDRPEIHSGSEDFAVENYVQPKREVCRARGQDETQIILPLKSGDEAAVREITEGFKRLGPSALLFLRQIDEINWSVEGGESGVYLRSAPESLGPGVQLITVIGHESGQQEVDQNWLVFHRDVFSVSHERVGRVEVAFSLHVIEDAPTRWSIQPVATSPLVVFFPTVVSTNLGFLVQGPYRTTPSRDNIPRGDPWNQHLVKETASLLVEAMRWMRDQSMLNISALRCLPLDHEKFPIGSMFAPLFEAVRDALICEPLLPTFDGRHVPASQAKLARTQELRDLFSPEQVAMLFEGEVSAWLTGDITQDRAPEIRQYVMRELGVTEVTPVSLVPRLNRVFLEAQPDNWILRLYDFLSGQEAALRGRLDTTPLIRLADGSHVVARENGKPKAFLPSSFETGFPTMRPAVCATAEVRSFLTSLGITEPDPVDDVVWNILPKYRRDELAVDKAEYAADIERIHTAFTTDSKAQRDKLLAALREASFVKVVDAGDGKGYLAKPVGIYIATDRLKQLFAGVSDVLIVDDSYHCLRGEGMRDLLEACGALRYPRPVEAPGVLKAIERQELRRQAGHEATSGINDRIIDWLLQGFDDLLKALPALPREERVHRASLIWDSLGDLEERRGRGVFEGAYSWTHNGNYKKEFPASFVRHLNAFSWVPDVNGELHPPSLVMFAPLGWKSNPFLLSKIFFKPPIIDQLAKEAGIDPAALDLLKKLGITSVAELTSRLGITEQPSEPEAESGQPDAIEPTANDVYADTRDLYGDDMPEIPPGTSDPDGGDGAKRGSGSGGSSTRGGEKGNDGSQASGSGHSGERGKQSGCPDRSPSSGPHGKRPPQGGGRPFISYVGTHPHEDGFDPDGLDQATRMRVEEMAIEKIIRFEPALNRTPAGTPGYDLYENDSNGEPVRWVEVKSMTGTLADRPVGISRTQFDYARDRGTRYWLYVVEHATDPQQARILRIQDPVAHARTFTFDHGWIEIAQTKPPA
jgi:hypothetical protein